MAAYLGNSGLGQDLQTYALVFFFSCVAVDDPIAGRTQSARMSSLPLQLQTKKRRDPPGYFWGR